MESRNLGRTGLTVSMVALGSGGHSRIGLGTGKTAAQSVAIVRQALDSGITMIDSSEMYGTEGLVGEGLSGVGRTSVVLSTKGGIRAGEGRKTGAQLEASLDASLKRLRTDYVDVYHLHGIGLEDYPYCREELVPALQKMKQAGKIRHIGITERFAADTGHAMLQQALRDDCWEVMMVGYNFLNPSARTRVIRTAAEKGIGILDMFAVRHALIGPEQLAGYLKILVENGQIDADRFDWTNPLGGLLKRGGYTGLTELAYRFCCSEPGISSILVGTGEPTHLEQNLRDIGKGTLPDRDREELLSLFGRVDSVSGD